MGESHATLDGVTEYIIAGRYKLTRVLGEGGMARVYEAEDRRLGRRVAVKLLLPQFTSDPEFLRRFEQEGRLAASLSHPNVVGVFDVGQDGQYHYIVMELVDGQTLKDAITRSAPLPVAEAIRIAMEVCAGISIAHSRGMVHRDIKPQNILLTADGQVKVADFGIARRATSATVTQTGTVLGSVHYLSPEQAQGLEAGPRSDLYALGITLYEMLTGRVPFNAENPIAVAMQQVQATPAPPRQLNRGIPPALEAVILRLLAKNPNDRFPDAASVIVALRIVLGQADGSTRVYSPGPQVAPGTKPQTPPGTQPTRAAGPTGTGFAPLVITQTAAPPPPAAQRRTGRRSILAGILAGGVVALVVLVALAILSSGGNIPGLGGGATATPPGTDTPIATVQPTQTAVPVLVPTHPRPTHTPVPTRTPKPTVTQTPLATVTESASFTPSPTPVPPTGTATATATATAPPTATWTPLPSPTPFPTIPADTSTPIPTETIPVPTSTPVPADTATPIPSDTATAAPTLPADTATPLPTVPVDTATPLPTVPADTATPLPTVPVDTATPVPTFPLNTDTPAVTTPDTATPASTVPRPFGTATATAALGTPDVQPHGSAVPTATATFLG